MGIIYTYLNMSDCRRDPFEEDDFDNWYPDQLF